MSVSLMICLVEVLATRLHVCVSHDLFSGGTKEM